MAQVTLKIKIDLPGLRSELAEVIKEITTKLEPIGTVNIDADTSSAVAGLQNVTEGINQTDKAANQTRNTLAQWGMILSGYQAMLSSLQQAWDVLSKPLDVAGEFEQYNTQFEVLLGGVDKAEARIAELTEFAAKTPFEMPGIVKASLQLENLTKGALSTAPGLTMVGDVAAGVNQPIEELSTWFGRLYDGIQNNRPVGEALMRLQELGILSGEARGKIESLQEANEDSAVIWNYVTTEMDKFNGMMEKQSTNYLGLKSTASDTINLLVADIGNKLLPTAKEATTAFIESIELIRENMDVLLSLIKTAGATFVVYQISVNGVSIAISAYTAVSKAAAIATRIFNTAIKSNPIGLIATAFTGLIVLLGELTDWFGLATDEQDSYTASTERAAEASRKLKVELDDIREMISKQTDDQLAKSIATWTKLLEEGGLDADRVEFWSNYLNEAEKELERRNANGIKLSKEAQALKVEAMKEGKAKELAELDLWYKEELLKFKGKEDAITALKTLYNKKRKDIDTEFAKIAEKDATNLEKLKIEAMQEGKEKELAELDLWYKEEKTKFAENKDALVQLEIIYQNKRKSIDNQFSKNQSDLEELKIKNRADGLEEELQLLDYHYQLDLEKFKDNEEMKVELLKKLELDKLAVTKDFADKEAKIAKAKIDEQKQEYEQFIQSIGSTLLDSLSYERQYSDAEVKLQNLRYKEELQDLEDSLAKGDITHEAYLLKRKVAEEQQAQYLKSVEEDRQTFTQRFAEKVYNQLINMGAEYVIKYGSQKLAELIVDKTFETTKTASAVAGETARTAATTIAATERTTIFAAETGTQVLLANTAMASLTLATIAAMTAISVAASTAATLVSIATFGGAAITGGAAVASALALIRGLSIAGFKDAGYTGEGNPNDVAGLVHKNEYVFESELVSKEKSQFEMLHKLLRSGMSLSQLFGKMTSISSPIVQPQFALAGISLTTPQISSKSEGTNQIFGKMESLLISIDKRLKTLESKPDLTDIPIKGEAKIKNKEIYIAFKKEEKLQKSRGIDVNNK